MTNFNERSNTLLYKKYNFSHFILERVMVVVCERWAEDGTDCYIDPKFFWPIAALLPHLYWVAQPWVTESPSPLSGAGSYSTGILSPTDSSRLCPGYIVSRPPASTVLPLIYTGASLDWWLGRGSIYNTSKYIYIYIYIRTLSLIQRYKTLEKWVLWVQH